MSPDLLKLARALDACLRQHRLKAGPGSSVSSDNEISVQSILSQVYLDLDPAETVQNPIPPAQPTTDDSTSPSAATTAPSAVTERGTLADVSVETPAPSPDVNADRASPAGRDTLAFGQVETPTPSVDANANRSSVPTRPPPDSPPVVGPDLTVKSSQASALRAGPEPLAPPPATDEAAEAVAKVVPHPSTLAAFSDQSAAEDVPSSSEPLAAATAAAAPAATSSPEGSISAAPLDSPRPVELARKGIDPRGEAAASPSAAVSGPAGWLHRLFGR
jgi:hypothetical protein